MPARARFDPADFGSLSIEFVEPLYARYSADPASVPADWRAYFESLPANGVPVRIGPSFAPSSVFNPPAPLAPLWASAPEADVAGLQDRVDQLVRAYRVRGHLIARIDPLERPRADPPELHPDFYGFTDADLDRRFSAETIHGPGMLALREILDRLRNTYCRSIGVQYMHIDDLALKRWLERRMEGTENRLALGIDEQKRILTRLTDAVIFEEFVQKKFLGAKSFSLEGSESLIPLLDLAIETAVEQGLQEIVLAMAHRGRLDVLANVLGKSAHEIFAEFEDKDPELQLGRGDVKYHLGYSTEWTSSSGKTIHLSLCFNPSHLEYVDPVAIGRVRAKQDATGDLERVRGMALLIHGDAAFAGEGIVQETLNLSQLEGYRTGGTLHVVVNNQIGFTTPPEQARSSPYATDVAKMLQIPIFHVNGEDPEAVAQVVRLAMEFRHTFHRDVVIDMYGYRRHGHSELDEPAFTQPLMQRAIDLRKSVRDGYLQHLLALGGVTADGADAIAVRRRRHLEDELSVARAREPRSGWKGAAWQDYRGGPDAAAAEIDTAVGRERLAALLEVLTRLPADFRPHPKIERWLEARREMARGAKPLDWAAAEALAFASVATDGLRVRLSGQDSERGTFSQRHAVLFDVENGRRHMPLANVAGDQAPVEIVNSPLSEAGVLGFEYGYSLDCPEGLLLWEAQFGDFFNAAQVFVDQFLASAEDKWQRLSGLVLLLPHGFEGMGPEHSSARIERFLSLAAEDNLQIVQPTTPAQYFHCLRRQALRKWRKPLVVMTPKSLLRDPRATSTLDECASGRFERILADPAPPALPTRVLLCTGKVYYDLVHARQERGATGVAIARIEQLYPLAEEALHAALDRYPDGTPVVWVQEEPENMGAWRHLCDRFTRGGRLLGRRALDRVCRPESASPATGSAASHRLEQARLIDQAFAKSTE